MASPHHRHQSSLEGVLDFSSPQPLEPDQRNRATDIFNQIVAQYEPCQTDGKGYKRITLLRVAHDSVISRDNFLSCFFIRRKGTTSGRGRIRTTFVPSFVSLCQSGFLEQTTEKELGSKIPGSVESYLRTSAEHL